VKKPMLEIQNLTKYYGKIRGIESLSLRWEKGDGFGFIKPNGAGKFTTIRCVMNKIHNTSGKVLIENKELHKGDSDTKATIDYLRGEVHLYEDPIMQQAFFDLLQQEKAWGTMILCSTHIS